MHVCRRPSDQMFLQRLYPLLRSDHDPTHGKRAKRKKQSVKESDDGRHSFAALVQCTGGKRTVLVGGYF